MRLHVVLHGSIVGSLELMHGDRSTFRFDEHYLSEAQRPVLGRYYEDNLRADFVDSRTQSRLPPFFENLLPEENSPLRDLLARRANVPAHREFPLLAALG